MGALDGKVAIVTGGTSGIGARTVELFVEEGAGVVIAGRRHDRGEAMAKRLGHGTSFIHTDVAQEPEVKAMIDHALAKFGRLDCLFNNAGTPGQMTSVAEVDMERFDAIMADAPIRSPRTRAGRRGPREPVGEVFGGLVGGEEALHPQFL